MLKPVSLRGCEIGVVGSLKKRMKWGNCLYSCYFTVKIHKIPSMSLKKHIRNFRALNRFFSERGHSEIWCDKICFPSPKLGAKYPPMPTKLKLLEFIGLSIGLI